MGKVTSELVTLQKESTQKIDSITSTKGLQSPPYDVNGLAKIYGYNGYHSKCINLKSIITAGLGYEIIPVNPDDNLKPDDEHKRIQEFINSQPGHTKQTFIETLINFQTDYEIFGNAYFEIVRDAKGEVSELYHIPAREVMVGLKEKTIFIAQVINGSEILFVPFGTENRGESHEFLMLKNYNPESRFYGLPDYIGALGAIIMDKNAVDFNIYKFNNMAIPETILVFKNTKPDKKTNDNIHKFFTSNLKGTSNAGRVLILMSEDDPQAQSSIEVKPVSSEVKEGSYRSLRIDARDEIISTHGVPKRLLGIAESGGLGGSGEGRNQLKVFQDCVIEPRQSRLEFLLNERLLKEGLKITKWKIKLNSLYIEDPAADATYYETMTRCGILTKAEAREELGYEPLEDADEEEVVEDIKKLNKSLKKLKQ